MLNVEDTFLKSKDIFIRSDETSKKHRSILVIETGGVCNGNNWKLPIGNVY